MVARPVVNRGPDRRMDDEFQERNCGNTRVHLEGKRPGAGKERVHDVVRVRRKPNEEEQRGLALDGMDDACQGGGTRETNGRPGSV